MVALMTIHRLNIRTERQKLSQSVLNTDPFKYDQNFTYVDLGAKKCSGGEIYSHSKKSESSATFYWQSKKVHGDKYDYSKVKYSGTYNPVVIICPFHCEFEQVAKYHTQRKAGCPKCSKENGSRKRSLTFKDRIQQARMIHGSIYMYRHLSNTRVTILCPTHGEFEQRWSDHIHGRTGCPKCQESVGERMIWVWLEHHDIKHECQKRLTPA